MNYRQPSVVETVIWLSAAAIAAFVALGVTLLMAAIGTAMLITKMVGDAVRSGLQALFPAGAGQETARNKSQRPTRNAGARPTVIDGRVISRG
ncbi:hypothetical protein GC197_05350 [bacterium]|nr:hypothetical protein [bacterium]